MVYVNGREALRERRPEKRGPYEFRVGGHPARILVGDGAGPDALSYHLTVDGRPIEPAAPAIDTPAVVSGTPPAGNARLRQQRDTGARWFYWIAGFSAANSLLSAAGSSLGFVVGLALTYFVDAGFRRADDTAPPIAAIAVDLLIAGVFAFFGRAAHRGRSWPFVVGGILYLLDGGLLLFVGDFVSLAFHGYALLWIFRGWRAARALARAPIAPPLTA